MLYTCAGVQLMHLLDACTRVQPELRCDKEERITMRITKNKNKPIETDDVLTLHTVFIFLKYSYLQYEFEFTESYKSAKLFSSHTKSAYYSFPLLFSIKSNLNILLLFSNINER